MERTTTKIYKQDLAALREINEVQELRGIADTISWLLDRHLATTPPARRLCVVITENEAGEFTAAAWDDLSK